MSLPPIDQEKTAAGIAVDPRTLERVVPESKRADGTYVVCSWKPGLIYTVSESR